MQCAGHYNQYVGSISYLIDPPFMFFSPGQAALRVPSFQPRITGSHSRSRLAEGAACWALWPVCGVDRLPDRSPLSRSSHLAKQLYECHLSNLVLMSLASWYDSISFHFRILVFPLRRWFTMMHGTDATLHASCASLRDRERVWCSIFVKSLLLVTPLFGNV